MPLTVVHDGVVHTSDGPPPDPPSPPEPVETELVVRTQGGTIERCKYPAEDSLKAEFDAFADAVAGREPYPISMDEMVHTIAAFDAIVRSIESGRIERT